MKVKLEGMVFEAIRGKGLENEKKERYKESYEEKPRWGRMKVCITTGKRMLLLEK